MAGLMGTVGLLIAEGGLVDEQVGAVRDGNGHVAGRGVAAEDELAAAAGGAQDLVGSDACAVAGRDRLAPLKAAEVRARLHAPLDSSPLVEAARAILLDQRVPVCLHAMAHVER